MDSSDTKKKVLIVEDDFFIRDLYVLQAKKAGYEVIIASDGEEGKYKAETENPDIALIDLMIPKIDGLTLIKTLKANPKLEKVPFLIITNLEDAAKEQEAREAGVTEYLLKIKYTPQAVMDKVDGYLSHP